MFKLTLLSRPCCYGVLNEVYEEIHKTGSIVNESTAKLDIQSSSRLA